MKKSFAIASVLISILLLSCNDALDSNNNNSILSFLLGKFTAQGATYTVTYDGNGNDAGYAPLDDNRYATGSGIAVLGNTGALTRAGYTFIGWNTADDGSGSAYSQGQSCIMGRADLALYASWVPDTTPTCTVTYNGNSNTGGTAPVDTTSYLAGQTVTALPAGTLQRTGYAFIGWNTAANGSGTGHASGDTFLMEMSDVTLYAQWTTLPTYTVTYNGNGSTGGTVPTDTNNYLSGATVTVLGNTGALARSGYAFNGWNTAANGSGAAYDSGDTFAMGSANVTLYAQWIVSSAHTVTYSANSGTGSVPVDAATYTNGQTVTVAGNTGTPVLTNTGSTFGGWNTAANGSGTTYTAGSALTMGSSDVILYALWKTEYTVVQTTYSESGTVAGYDATDTLERVRTTIYRDIADYEATYNQNYYMPMLIFSGLVGSGQSFPTALFDSEACADYLTPANSYSYQNYFDASGIIEQTDLYDDTTFTTRTGYWLYTLNSDGTCNKILTYDDGGSLTGSIYFTNVNGRMTQVDFWDGGDGTGANTTQMVMTYDTSNRITSQTILADAGSGLENNTLLEWTYTGLYESPTTITVSLWDGSSWASGFIQTNTLNGTGSLVLFTTFTGLSYSQTYTYNGSNFYDAITVYSDSTWTTESGYIFFTYP